MTDDRTTNLNLPLPSAGNTLAEDVLRLRNALVAIDTAINDKADAQDIADQLSALIDGAPGVLDTIKELADALGNNPEFAADVAADLASITSSIASIQSTLSALAASTISYSGAASGISATTVQGAIDYLKNTTSGGSGGSQASYTRQKFTATAGQTIFTTSGYSVGYLEVFLNGVLLDITDYTAANGSTVVLSTGATAGDEVVTIALDSFNIANLLRVLTASASAPSGAVSVGDDGGLIVKSLNGGALSGMRNRIINGDMRIDQRFAGGVMGAMVGAGYTVDRWRVFRVGGTSTLTPQQSTVAPAGFKNSLIVTVGSGATPATNEERSISQAIEGFNVADLGWGASGASPVTLSFWVRSSVTGTFGLVLGNSGASRSYVASYAINAANTWEYKTITVPGDTSGTWLTNNGAGLILFWDLGVGPSYSGSATGSWQAAVLEGLTGGTKLSATTGATFNLTGVQLEKGSVATPFEVRPYGMELALCQRYYWDTMSNIAVGGLNSSGGIWSTGPFPVRMRATPSATKYNEYVWSGGTPSISGLSDTIWQIHYGSNSGVTNCNVSAKFSAEL